MYGSVRTANELIKQRNISTREQMVDRIDTQHLSFITTKSLLVQALNHTLSFTFDSRGQRPSWRSSCALSPIWEGGYSHMEIYYNRGNCYNRGSLSCYVPSRMQQQRRTQTTSPVSNQARVAIVIYFRWQDCDQKGK
jgi:hypothetical protein